jgi:AcrR family transcriptional regulator
MSRTVVDAPRRALTPKRADTVQRLTDAAVEEVEAVGFDALTVRSVAKRAGVAPATAYTYFGSKEHLVTEAFWRRLAVLPEPVVTSMSGPERVLEALSGPAGFFAEQPALVAACTRAMVADDPDVRHVRDRFANEIHRRLVLALGDRAAPDVVRALELATAGALLRAGTGHMSHTDVPAVIADVAGLLVS